MSKTIVRREEIDRHEGIEKKHFPNANSVWCANLNGCLQVHLT